MASWAEAKERSAQVGDRAGDLALLKRALDFDLGEQAREAFASMLADLTGDEERHCLSTRQRDWVRTEIENHEPTYENAYSAGRVPRGREVETAPVLRNLPKSSPGRK